MRYLISFALAALTSIIQAPVGGVITVPAGTTLPANNMVLASGTTLRVQGTLLYAPSGSSSFFVRPAVWATNVSILCDPGGVIDGAGFVPTTGQGFMIFVDSNTNFVVKGCTFRNSGTPSNAAGGMLIYNSSATIDHNTMTDSTVLGTQIKIDGATGKPVRVTNNTLYGSQANAIQALNSATYVARSRPLDIQILYNTIAHVSDGFAGSGETGNAISLWQCDGCIADYNDVSDLRFSGVRIALSADAKAGFNKISKARESSMYCELGAINCWVHDNTISDYIDGVNATNVSQRVPCERNTVENNTLVNGSHYGVKAEYDIVRGNKVDGVPFCYLVGFGGTSHDNILENNSCTRSSPAYTPVIAAVGIDTSITVGTDRISGLSFSNTLMPQGVFPVALPNTAMITGISNAASAVVTYNAGERPLAKDTICFLSIVGMPINGQCAAVTASTATTATVALDTRALGTFVAPVGSQRSYATIILRNGAPRYSLPPTLAYTPLPQVAPPTGLTIELDDQ